MRWKTLARFFLTWGSPGQILRRCLVEILLSSGCEAGVKRILRTVADLPQKHAERLFKAME